MKHIIKRIFCKHEYKKKRGNVDFFFETKCCDYFICNKCGKIEIK